MAYEDDLFEEDVESAGVDEIDLEVTLLIYRHRKSGENNLPSHFFPGAGSDACWFEIMGEDRPSSWDLCRLLHKEDVDFMLMDYDEIEGKGYFVAVDSYGPEPGTLILKNKSPSSP
jgi:hypothetical protein